MTRVVVGIVTYNSTAHWEACWHALQGQYAVGTGPALSSPLQIEIHIYDNASTDATVAAIRRLAPNTSLTISPINRGYGAAHNALIATAHLQPGDFYFALNPDAILEPGYIACLVAALQNDPRAGWATGALYKPDGRIYSMGHALRRDAYAINIGYDMNPNIAAARHTTPTKIFGAPGAAVLIKAELLHDLGTAFDESFFVYNEDVDFDWRARRRGWYCLCVPDAKAIHEGSHADQEGQARAVVNRWLMSLKNADTWNLIVYNPPRWIVHVLLRLCVTPRYAIWMLARFFRLMPQAWQARRADPPRWRDPEMAKWFAWAKDQPTHQPQNYWQRWRTLLRRSFEK